MASSLQPGLGWASCHCWSKTSSVRLVKNSAVVYHLGFCCGKGSWLYILNHIPHTPRVPMSERMNTSKIKVWHGCKHKKNAPKSMALTWAVSESVSSMKLPGLMSRCRILHTCAQAVRSVQASGLVGAIVSGLYKSCTKLCPETYQCMTRKKAVRWERNDTRLDAFWHTHTYILGTSQSWQRDRKPRMHYLIQKPTERCTCLTESDGLGRNAWTGVTSMQSTSGSLHKKR